MRIPILVMAAGLAGACLLPAQAHAASFDCARASKVDEIAICRNPQLSMLDSEMGGLWYAYSRVPMAMGGNGDRGDEARDFLARRRACLRDVGCLAGLYRRRNAALRAGIDGAMADYFRLQNAN